jgi:hypothetical protein
MKRFNCVIDATAQATIMLVMETGEYALTFWVCASHGDDI